MITPMAIGRDARSWMRWRYAGRGAGSTTGRSISTSRSSSTKCRGTSSSRRLLSAVGFGHGRAVVRGAGGVLRSNVETFKGGVAVGVGNGGDDGAGAGGGVVVRRAFVTASLSLLIARHEGWSGSARRAGGRARVGERCDPLARSGRRSGAGCCGGPELGGASEGKDALAGDVAVVGERGEGLVELGCGGVAVQQVAQLGAGQPVGECVGQRGVDLVSERVAGGPLKRPAGGALRVVPERERGVQVDGLDLAGVVEQRVEERKADGVRFGARCDRAGDPGLGLGELLVGVCPGVAGCG